ncbi:MAG: methionine adenosyltransferase [Pseudoflavonifractor sp.]|nr:methionine adenosyltransferase [Alloprevotella sp.]MCM1116481.1 methionine adenosyltransferase [Pseudoflavonifractor sp.]
MNYLFTSESVSEGHPDKVADQISDAILDAFLAHDPESKVACETLVTTGQVVIAGEVKSNAYIDIPKVVRQVIDEIGYNRSAIKFDAESCGIFSAIHEQSGDINRGVERCNPADQGAGDQGMMFGYATDETETFMPLPLYLSHLLMAELANIRREKKQMTWTDPHGRRHTYLRPDAKSQVTVEYTPGNRPVAVKTIVISTQHDEFILPSPALSQEQADKQMQQTIESDIRSILIPRVKARLKPEVASLIPDDVELLVNPTGKFVIGGPHGDTGLTGRKIIVDTYGGRGAHGGGAFSGKDPSKVDRSAAYAARHIAKNIVAAGLAKEALVQVAYAIGRAEPVSFYVDTKGSCSIEGISDGELSARIAALVPMKPADIVERFHLKTPIYRETAAYGHMGREPRKVVKHFTSRYEGPKDIPVELFPWEKLDLVDSFRNEFFPSKS